ncbi:uncharacterized protein LOC129966448 [Argiope bruennichi]|uniref:uncharacterized protein LOC129966448 n=1 Tax=Argiope bruennichi TaxID=94029 RepID=UPI002494D9F1|nr:uncharacterized protein LOC129966448 [Argiope bruennichi]
MHIILSWKLNNSFFALKVLLLSFVCVVTSSLVPVSELFPPELYKHGQQYNGKEGDAGAIYGIVEDQGSKRLIEYMTNKGGFRAEVKTNETGSTHMNTASVKTLMNPKTTDVKRTELAIKEASLAQFENFYKGMTDVYKEALASAKKDFFMDAILANKKKEKKANVDDPETKLDLVELYKLGLILPKIFEMYTTKEDVMTYLKYLLDEPLFLSLFHETKNAPKKGTLLDKIKALTKLNDDTFQFAPMEVKKHFPNFGK